ncbi:MAG TPA: substrate-binding and VWA domain-containing protein [Candidatus Rothia avicola]|uniref:Substrate-binding and VWA domain-containing protein n=1 Tax=Candidatus Rothia avicola TaxID=2840478 RepID=A0A9D2CR11_9MICC|nr:substrate-binding and VWA domain-containing protein [Candidatus Rothia avicola]
MANNAKSRRQERIEKQKKNSRKWIATGAAAVILLCGGAIAYTNITGDKQPSTTSGQTVPAACSTTQAVTVATTEPMAAALKAMLVDEDTCITLDITTDKTASDVLTESTSGTATTNLWIPDSTTRAELAMSEANTGLTPLAESLAQTPGVIVSEDNTSYGTWLEALKAEGTVSMGDPKEDSGAFAALLGGISEASAGTVSLEDLTSGTALRAQSIGVTEAAQSATELLTAVDNGTKDAAIVTEADYAAYASAHADSGLTATVPGDGSFALNYPLYQASSSNNTTIDEAAQQIINFMGSEDGKQALAAAGLRAADGQELEGDYSVGSFTALAPSNQDVLTQVWTSYSLQSAPLNALVVLDASGSMLLPVAGTDKSRMDITVESVLAGSQLFPARDSMGLWKFSRDLTLPDGSVSDYQELVPVRGFEETVDGKTQRVLLQEAGSGIAATIDPNGFTALYDTTLAAFRSAKENYAYGSVNAVIVLTDGENHDDNSISQEELISTIQAEQDPANPVFIIMIGVSEDADMNALTTIAQGVGGEAHMASAPTDVQRIFAEALTGISDAAAQQ